MTMFTHLSGIRTPEKGFTNMVLVTAPPTTKIEITAFDLLVNILPVIALCVMCAPIGRDMAETWQRHGIRHKAEGIRKAEGRRQKA